LLGLRRKSCRDFRSCARELFFFRSADWCPYCQAQTIDLNTTVAALERRGYRMAGISDDNPPILKTFIDRRRTS